MIIPALQGLVDEMALMKAVAMALRDDQRLAKVPIASEMHFYAEAETALDVLWTLPADALKLTPDGFGVVPVATPDPGPVGCGILVETPEMSDRSPGVRKGSPATWKVGIVGFCEPNTAFLPGTGCGFTSSQLCQLAQDVLQLMFIYGFGTLQTEENAITAARDWTALKPGISAHRLTLSGTVGRVVSERSAPVTAMFGGGLCTLTCSDGTAEVRYTTDGTPPFAVNPASTVYQAQFAVDSGATVQFYSRKAGLVPGHVNGAVAP